MLFSMSFSNISGFKIKYELRRGMFLILLKCELVIASYTIITNNDIIRSDLTKLLLKRPCLTHLLKRNPLFNILLMSSATIFNAFHRFSTFRNILRCTLVLWKAAFKGMGLPF